MATARMLERINVESQSGKVKDLLREAIRSVAAGEKTAQGGHDYVYEGIKGLGHVAVPVGWDHRVDIAYSGQTVKFEYSGVIEPLKKGRLGKSNERYDPRIVNAIGGIEGVTNFVGVIGGLDASLAQLSILSQGNELSMVSLVDRDLGQAVYAMLKLVEFDTHSLEYLVGWTKRFDALGGVKEKPQQLDVKFVSGDIRETIAGLDNPARYFIYFSNVFEFQIFAEKQHPNDKYNVKKFPGHLNLQATYEVLANIFLNKNVLEGSVLLFAEPNSANYILVEKQADAFRPISVAYTADGKPQTSNADSRRVVVDMDLQNLFFDELTSTLRRA
jgi:hypothetical protein